MGDAIRDPFDDSDDEDIDQPRTPDIQHGGDVGSPGTPDGPGFSDISDNEDKDSAEGVVAEDSGGNEDSSEVNSPDREGEDGSKEILNNEHENKQESSNSSPTPDFNASPASLKSEEAAETIEPLNVSKEDKLVSDRIQGEKETTLESQETKQDSAPNSSPVEVQDNENDHHYDNKTATEEPTENEDRDNSGENEFDEEAKISRRRRESSGAFTDDDVEMPISPLGLGLSGPESEIVEDILKSDVSKLLPNVSEGVDLNTPGDNNNDDESVQLDSEEEATPKTDAAEQNEEGSDSGEAGDQLIADIFGASDEEEEFEGFGQEDIEVTRKKKGARDKINRSLSGDEGEEKAANLEEPMTVPKPKPGKTYDSDNDDDDKEFNDKPVFVSDFDLMIQKKKEINRSFRRKRKNFDIINDSDDLIAGMIKQMKEVAEEDRLLNGAKQAATKKLKMFPSVLRHLNKADLQMTFLDLGVLPVLKDWLSPLPDGSLPHLQIREGLLKVLSEFPPMDTGSLKMSGLGKTVMYLYRHPKETRQNKEIAGKLINDWARPIFGVTSNFKSLSREEREERDYQNMSKRRRLSSHDSDGGRTPKSIDSALQSEKKPVRPGDKGFVMRARVPMPSNKDYVVRPQNTIDRIDFSKKPQKSMNRFEKQKRKFDEKKKLLNRGSQRAVDISIEGRKMAL